MTVPTWPRWEQVDEGALTMRLAVHGGWLISHKVGNAIGFVVLPDWNHTWGTVPLRMPNVVGEDE